MSKIATLTYKVFDAEKFKASFLQSIDNCMEDAIRETFGRHPYFQGLQIEKNGDDNIKDFNFYSTHFKAFIMEYGSGMYMDEERNPYIEEYKKSVFYESGRENHGNKILGRGDQYIQKDYIDGKEIVTRTGTAQKGVVLPDNLQKAFSQKPQPFLQNLFIDCYKMFNLNVGLFLRHVCNAPSNYFVTRRNG